MESSLLIMEKTTQQQHQRSTQETADLESGSKELGTAVAPSFQLQASSDRPKDTEEELSGSPTMVEDDEFSWGGALAGGIIGGVVGAIGGAMVGGPVGAIAGGIGGAVGGAVIGGLVGGASSPSVTFGVVNATSSPAGMPKRIAPTVNTSVSYTVANHDPSKGKIELSIEGANDTNGKATIDGTATKEVAASGAVALNGTKQTAAGSAGHLVLVAKLAGTVIGRSNAFSVSAIPQNWNISFNRLIDGDRRGVAVNNAWESDSNSLAHLDEVERSEKVEYSGTGIFAGTTSGHNSGFLPGNNSPRVDSHSYPVSGLTGEGQLIAKQGFIFNDRRSGATNIPAKNSGFRITRDVVSNGAGGFNITTTKEGAGHTTRGYTVTAGSGSVSRTQAV